MAAGRAPGSTYRLQLTPDFGFAEAAEAGEYLADLGVTHVYLSPVLEAVPGSLHGYDVTDHSRIRGEFGGEEGFRAMAKRLRGLGLGLVLDIVPNHMAVPADLPLNRQLWSVLRDGRASPYAHLVRHRLDGAAASGCCCRFSAARSSRASATSGWSPTAGRTASPRSGTSTTCCRCGRGRRGCRCAACSSPSTTGWPGGVTPRPS